MTETTSSTTTTPEKQSSGNYILIFIIIVLGILSSFFGYSYKSTTNLLETANKTISDLQEKLVTSSNSTTTSTPVLIGGKIAYKTVTVKNKKSLETVSDLTNSTSTSKSFEQTITKKGNTLFGVGYGTDSTESIEVQSDLLGPFGLASVATFSIDPLPSFKEAILFITFKP